MISLDAAYIELAKFGASGALIVVLIIWVRSLQDRLLAVVEKNTAALVGVKSALELCQAVHGGRKNV